MIFDSEDMPDKNIPNDPFSMGEFINLGSTQAKVDLISNVVYLVITINTKTEYGQEISKSLSINANEQPKSIKELIGKKVAYLRDQGFISEFAKFTIKTKIKEV